MIGDSEGRQNSSHVGADYTESSGVPERSPSQGGKQWAVAVVPATRWLSSSSSVPTSRGPRTVLQMKNRTRSTGLGVGKHKQSKGVCLPLRSYRGRKRRCLRRAGKHTVMAASSGFSCGSFGYKIARQAGLTASSKRLAQMRRYCVPCVQNSSSLMPRWRVHTLVLLP